MRAEGTPCESLYTGPEAMRPIGPEARREIAQIFPALCPQDPPASARPILSGKRLGHLIARHRKNARPFIEAPAPTV